MGFSHRFSFNSCVDDTLFFLLLVNRKSAAKFLLDVNKNLNEEANENTIGGRSKRNADSDEGENFITDDDKVAIKECDIISTFSNKSECYFYQF